NSGTPGSARIDATLAAERDGNKRRIVAPVSARRLSLLFQNTCLRSSQGQNGPGSRHALVPCAQTRLDSAQRGQRHDRYLHYRGPIRRRSAQVLRPATARTGHDAATDLLDALSLTEPAHGWAGGAKAANLGQWQA